MTDNVLIQTINLEKSFGELKVLRGINEVIHKGEVVTVIGPRRRQEHVFAVPEHAGGAHCGDVIFEGVKLNDKATDITSTVSGMAWCSKTSMCSRT